MLAAGAEVRVDVVNDCFCVFRYLIHNLMSWCVTIVGEIGYSCDINLIIKR